MRDTIAQVIAHFVVWLREGTPIECWLARTAAHDALQKGCSLSRAISRGIAAGTDLQERRNGR